MIDPRRSAATHELEREPHPHSVKQTVGDGALP